MLGMVCCVTNEFIKINVKAIPTYQAGPVGRKKYSSTHIQPCSRMGWVVNITHRPLYPLEGEPVHTVQENGWASASLDASGILLPPGFKPQTIQPVPQCYTDHIITATN
jgi:hypothetical protein